ncbi:hypothetical protein GCM10020331_002950 [Ectobacillus funiculus]
MLALPIAILTARIYYVIFEWSYYKKNHPSEIIAIWHGGIAIHGGVIGAVFDRYLVLQKEKPFFFWKLADILAPSLLLGQAIGRWGNFMNQEAHGGDLHLELFRISSFARVYY